jgi:hypothetical protein
MLTNPSNTNVGVVKSRVLYLTLPVPLWIHQEKPALIIDRYSTVLSKSFGEFVNFRDDIGTAEFQNGEEGIQFIGPRLDLVSTIRLWWEKLNDTIILPW